MRYRNYKVATMIAGGLLSFSLTNAIYAGGPEEAPMPSPWHAIVAVGGGAALNTSDIATSQTFPIGTLQPIFYTYNPSTTTRTAGLWQAFLGAEYVFPQYVALQFGVDYTETSDFYVKGLLTQGYNVATQTTYGYKYTIIPLAVLVEAKLLYQNAACRVHPYVLGGVGVGVNRAENFTNNVNPMLETTRFYANNTQTSFAWNVGAGVDFDLNRIMQFGVGYRFAGMGKVALGSATIDGAPYAGTLSTSKLYLNEILAQLTFVVY